MVLTKSWPWRSLMLLLCRRCASVACRLLDAEGWRWVPFIRKRRIDFLLLHRRRGPPFRFLLQATSGVEDRRACSGLLKVFNEALPVFIAEQFLFLVIGGFSSWNFSKTPVAAVVFTQL